MNPYTRKYFEKRNYLIWRSKVLAEAINSALHPSSVLDVGCSTGDIVKGFLDLGIDAYGIDLHTPLDMLLFPLERFTRLNIKTETLADVGPYALVTCIETVSILPQNEEVVENVCRNLMRWGEVILLSAAPDLRFPYDKYLAEQGYERYPGAEAEIRKPIEEIKHRLAVKALYHGVSVWRKGVSIVDDVSPGPSTSIGEGEGPSLFDLTKDTPVGDND